MKLFDRDLSWLSFNHRVLLEAKDKSIPLLERLRFLAIFSSNLDEFFRVRVAGIQRLADIDKKKINKALSASPQEIIQHVHREVDRQLHEYGQVLKQVLIGLKGAGLHIKYTESPQAGDLPQLHDYFKTHLLGLLQITKIKENVSPFLNNQGLYFAIRLRNNKDMQSVIINIPSDKVSRFYPVYQPDKKVNYYFIDDIIRLHLSAIFPTSEIIECYSIKLNKDADLQIDDEFSGNLAKKIQKQIRIRNLGAPARFLFDQRISPEFLNQLSGVLQLKGEDLYGGGCYHNLHDFFKVKNLVNANIEYPTQIPIRHKQLDQEPSIFEAVQKQDQILHFPYQSYDYVLQFFNEASIHPYVKAIDVTFYRMAENSLIGEALISAAKNGKRVNVFMEVKARFDEENNLQWATKMQDAGIRIRYSMPGLKVHAKVALITIRNDRKTSYLGFFGTGNLNEGTARIYCDHGLLTAHKGMTAELKKVFSFLISKKHPGQLKHLIVSQFGAMERFIELIDREVSNEREGLGSGIIIKMNNMEEPQLIKKLYEAARAGVKISVIARSICCLIPEKNLEVRRIVDRYLEHARIFSFYNNGKEELFMGSSDWMQRNLHHRVEVTFPIYQEDIRLQLKRLLQYQMEDNSKAVTLSKQLKNKFISNKKKSVRAQQASYDYLSSL